MRDVRGKIAGYVATFITIVLAYEAAKLLITLF